MCYCLLVLLWFPLAETFSNDVRVLSYLIIHWYDEMKTMKLVFMKWLKAPGLNLGRLLSARSVCECGNIWNRQDESFGRVTLSALLQSTARMRTD